MNVRKTIDLPVYLHPKKNFHRKLQFTHKLKLKLQGKKWENVRHFALQIQQLVGKGWCNESTATINLKCNETSARALPKNWKTLLTDGKSNTFTVREPSILFQALVKPVDAEKIWKEKIRTLDLTLEVHNLTSKLESQNSPSEKFDQLP